MIINRKIAIIIAAITLHATVYCETKGKVSFWNKTGKRQHFFVDWRSDSLFGSCKDQNEYVNNNDYISKKIGSGYCKLYRMRLDGHLIPIATELWALSIFTPKKYNDESPETCYIVANDRADKIDCALMYKKETDPMIIANSIAEFKKK